MIYFDNAATGGKKSQEVIFSCNKHFKNIANPGRSGHMLSIENAMKVYSLRDIVSNTFSTSSPDRVILTKNCSEALNLGIFGAYQKGSHIITTKNEHNSVLRPLNHLEKMNKIETSFVSPEENGEISLSSIKKQIRKDTKMICVNMVSNVTGGTSNVEEIGEYLSNTDIIFLVDGAQGLGHLPLSAKNIDILCAPFHKALGGIMGVGFCAFSEKVSPRPLLFGGNGQNSNSMEQGNIFPESFETGTLNMMGICGAYAGMKYTVNNFEKNRNHMKDLTHHIQNFKFKNMKVFSTKNECGIFSFLIDGYDSQEISNILWEKYKIACRGGLTCAPLIHDHLKTLDSGVTRISFDHFNTHKEIEFLAKALYEIAMARN